jgi:hypothetical protein
MSAELDVGLLYMLTNKTTATEINKQGSLDAAQRNRGLCGLRYSSIPLRCIEATTDAHGWPNPVVKGTCRPLAVLKVCFLIGFDGFAWLPTTARPLPLR